MTVATNIKKILEKHRRWLKGEYGGVRANLREADLYIADLREADLYIADLREANLYRANLSGADLRGANLSGADLRVADLRGADLRVADLRGADLRGADLREADLRGADLRGADLRGADLRGADLREADLREADLREANLYRANLREADLIDTKGIPPIACPEEGSFIGYKKADGNTIVKLQILEDSLRSSATSRKCRCSKALVLSITKLDDSKYEDSFVPSRYSDEFIYKVGEIVEVSEFDTDRWNECAPGIHFFITRQEAVEY